jgi:hypothetical protein
LARDDRILPETRIIGALIPPFLITAFVMLYLFPNNTEQLFAWTIKPTMTALMMGGGYVTGSYFFVRLVIGGRWSWYALGFLPIAAFTWFMAGATFLHWDKFNHAHVSFIAWLILYLVTPIVVPVLWLRNRRTDPGTPGPGDVPVPASIRTAARVLGIALVATAVLMFLVPETAASIWPWTLTPLTARVIAGWFVLAGLLAVMYSTEARWQSWRILLQSQGLGIALILLGVARAWGELRTDQPVTWIFVIGLSLLLVTLVALYATMEARRPHPDAERLTAPDPAQAGS